MVLGDFDMRLTFFEIKKILPEKDYKGKIDEGLTNLLKKYNDRCFEEGCKSFKNSFMWKDLHIDEEALVTQLKEEVKEYAKEEKVEYDEVVFGKFDSPNWYDPDVYIVEEGWQKTRKKLIPRVFNYAAFLRKWENAERIKEEKEAVYKRLKEEQKKKDQEKEEFRKREIEIEVCKAEEHVVLATESFIS